MSKENLTPSEIVPESSINLEVSTNPKPIYKTNPEITSTTPAKVIVNPELALKTESKSFNAGNTRAANAVGCNWNLEWVELNVKLVATNALTGESFEGNMEGFNKLLATFREG